MTRHFYRIIVLLVSMFAVYGCEGTRCKEGIVRDGRSGQPLDSVRIYVVSSDQKLYTDPTGWFSVCNPRSKCSRECKDIIIQYTKQGYKEMTLMNQEPDSGDVFLERL